MRIFTLTIIYIFFATPAFAYIDAALGSLVLQSLVAGFFTFMVMWRSWLGKVKSFFGSKKLQTDSDE
jgi:hypothetical protein